MKKVYKDRLKKLADHLIAGKLGHEKFDFSVWNRGRDRFTNVEPYKCGYAGCAIGECPIVFKKDWAFGIEGNPVLKNSYSTTKSAVGFFGLDDCQFVHLFLPDGQNTMKYGGKKLGENAKAKSVGNNILAFLAKQD